MNTVLFSADTTGATGTTGTAATGTINWGNVGLQALQGLGGIVTTAVSTGAEAIIAEKRIELEKLGLQGEELQARLVTDLKQLGITETQIKAQIDKDKMIGIALLIAAAGAVTIGLVLTLKKTRLIGA